MAKAEFAQHLKDGRAAMERAAAALIDAHSSFFLAGETSEITANQILLEKTCDLILRLMQRVDFETETVSPINCGISDRSINDCLAFMLDDDGIRESDYRVTEQQEKAR